MQRRRQSTLWFVLAAAWFVLCVLNIFRHREKNAIAIGVAVAAFLVIGVIYRLGERKGPANRKLR